MSFKANTADGESVNIVTKIGGSDPRDEVFIADDGREFVLRVASGSKLLIEVHPAEPTKPPEGHGSNVATLAPAPADPVRDLDMDEELLGFDDDDDDDEPEDPEDQLPFAA